MSKKDEDQMPLTNPIINLTLACRTMALKQEDGWMIIDLGDVDPDSIDSLKDAFAVVLEDLIEQRAQEIIEGREEEQMERRLEDREARRGT